MDEMTLRLAFAVARIIDESFVPWYPAPVAKRPRTAKGAMRPVEGDMRTPRRSAAERDALKFRRQSDSRVQRQAKRAKAKRKIRVKWAGQGKGHWIGAKDGAKKVGVSVPAFLKLAPRRLLADRRYWYSRPEVTAIGKRLAQQRRAGAKAAANEPTSFG